MLIAYASRTGTRRNLEALRAANWRLLVSATGVLRHEGFQYALDNGAWTAHQAGTSFDVPAFQRAVDALGHGADWIVLPDALCGGLESLELSLSYLPELAVRGFRLLLPVQNGMQREHVIDHLSNQVGIFVGGDDTWKEATLPSWGAVAREVGCWLHVGRVNSARRIRLCALAGAHSFDGTSCSRWAVNVSRLDRARLSCLPFGGSPPVWPRRES